MSKMKQIAALTAMLVGVILYASPAKSAVCFLPDDDGSCGGGDIEISDNNSNQDQCTDFKLSKNQRDSKEYSSDCYTCESCTYNNRTTYKCSPKSGATWYGGNIGICCTNGETYDSAEGQCCPAGGCTHDCPEGKSWNSSSKSCKCDNGKETSTGICCADEEHVDGTICCPEKKHNDGGKCVCDSQYNTDDNGNCILPAACTYYSKEACDSIVWGTSCQKDSNGCWWPSECNLANGYAQYAQKDCSGPLTNGEVVGYLGQNGTGEACHKTVCMESAGFVSEKPQFYDENVFAVSKVDSKCGSCYIVDCKKSCTAGTATVAELSGKTCPSSCKNASCKISADCDFSISSGVTEQYCTKAEVTANYNLTEAQKEELVKKVDITCFSQYKCVMQQTHGSFTNTIAENHGAKQITDTCPDGTGYSRDKYCDDHCDSTLQSQSDVDDCWIDCDDNPYNNFKENTCKKDNFVSFKFSSYNNVFRRFFNSLNQEELDCKSSTAASSDLSSYFEYTGYRCALNNNSGCAAYIDTNLPDIGVTCPTGYKRGDITCPTGETKVESHDIPGCYTCECRNEGYIHGVCTSCREAGYTAVNREGGYQCIEPCPLNKDNLFRTCIPKPCPSGYTTENITCRAPSYVYERGYSGDKECKTCWTGGLPACSSGYTDVTKIYDSKGAPDYDYFDVRDNGARACAKCKYNKTSGEKKTYGTLTCYK